MACLALFFLTLPEVRLLPEYAGSRLFDVARFDLVPIAPSSSGEADAACCAVLTPEWWSPARQTRMCLAVSFKSVGIHLTVI
jgi:hypothetical protein